MTTPLVTLQEKIRQLEIEQSSLALPSIAALEASILHHSARVHSLDALTAARHKNELQASLEAQAQAEINWQRNSAINREVALLRQEVAHAEHEERRHRAEKASKELDEANNEYALAARQLVRAFRKCMNIQKRNAGIPGAATVIPPGPHIPAQGFWSGNPDITTAQEMTYGLLPFERDEQDREAA